MTEDKVMDEENNLELYCVGSFFYENKFAAVKAQNEQTKIAKLEKQLDASNPKVIYSLYCKLIKRNVFETLEGISFLLKLQDYLYENRSDLPGQIPAIPAALLLNSEIYYNEKIYKDDIDGDIKDETYTKNLIESETETNGDTSIESESETNGNTSIESESETNIENPIELKKLGNNHVKSDKIYKKSDIIVYKIIIAFLSFIIAAMLLIALNSNSPNIINYRNEIQNEYADWEQKLNEKEAELNEREKNLQ